MRRGLLLGIVVWVVLSAIFKFLVDGYLFNLGGTDLRQTLPLIGVGAALLIAVTMRVLCSPGKAMRFGVGLAIPGMLLGSAALIAFGRFVARPGLEEGLVYAVFLMWTYGLILCVVALFGERIVPNEAGYGRYRN